VALELAIAAVVGLAAGFVADLALRGRRTVPLWLTTVVSAAAAIGGTIAAESVREEPLGPVLMFCAPLFFAALAVGVLTARPDGARGEPHHPPRS